MNKEQKFYNALRDVFIGAKIEGRGGFINLMRIKSNYYRKIEELLKQDIEKTLEKYPKFRDELFDKLYSFFNRYFTESGSIYFNQTPFHNNIYEKVYTDEKDVILFWKTQMLYYVKTDRIFRSLPVEFDGLTFYFDASKIESKKANEKRSLIFELSEVHEDGTIAFSVSYSEKGAKTKQDEILKVIKRKGIAVTEEQLERAFKIFEKQSEVDFFINKNAKAFLQEQFKLWSYQYFWEGAKEWGPERVNELQILKDIAFKIIDFIAQFEDELVKIWNKPKFVKNSNYVITLDRIKDAALIEKILNHNNIKEQIKEWEELGIVDKKFNGDDVFETDLTGRRLAKQYEHLPVDTKYFKDLELELLSQFEDLDKFLDGWLIKSENYQALNTILPKFKEKVQTIYIDPPFNTGDDFPYLDRFQGSSWLSLMIDRLFLGKEFLLNTGTFFLHLDKNANYYGRILLNKTLTEDNFKNEIIWGYEKPRIAKNKFKENHDNILFYCKDKTHLIFNVQYTEKKDNSNNRHEKDYEGKLLGDWWPDIPSFSTIMSAKERVYFPTQKPEKLIARIIDCSTQKDERDFVFDFFLGSGATTAVAHKLGKKWLGVEMGIAFSDFYEDIMTIDKTEEEVKESEDKFKVLEIIKDTKNQRVLRVLKFGILGKMKMVLAGNGHREPTKLSKDVNWQGGGFFKYYELEQYEEALANCKYEDGDLFNAPNRSPYQEYVFLKDEKMLKALEIDYENNKVKVDLSKLYENIDIAETLSNLTGKWIKKINEDEVEFEDGTKINTKDFDYKLIKPLIWW
jgi:adenine specific DNA methylase Mod